MSTPIMLTLPSDHTECPTCAAANIALGGGCDYADMSFNYGGDAWSVCLVHGVRWYATRELFGLADGDAALMALPEVEPVWRGR